MPEKTEISIVKARDEMYDGVISILDVSYPTKQDRIAAKKDLSRSTVLVAKSDGKIVGTVSYTHKVLGDGKSRETLEYRRNKKYHIWGMAVLPEYRRRGIGEQLLHEAERDMYKKNGKGYFGLAFSEEVAQWYVRTSGVRLRRLSPRYLTTVGVPFTKNFRQNGALEDMKKRLRYVLSLLLKRLHANPKAILERERSSRLPKEG